MTPSEMCRDELNSQSIYTSLDSSDQIKEASKKYRGIEKFMTLSNHSQNSYDYVDQDSVDSHSEQVQRSNQKIQSYVDLNQELDPVILKKYDLSQKTLPDQQNQIRDS